MKYRFIFSLIIVVALAFSCNKDEDQIASFTDARDGQTYGIVTIGEQVWMAENLNYAISPGTTWCYEDITGACETRGRLYSNSLARSACPAGWHLPSESEWDQMSEALGGNLVAGGKLKATGFEHWYAPNIGATNESGFSGLPFGIRNSIPSYEHYGQFGYWWSSTIQVPAYFHCFYLSYSTDELYNDGKAENYGLSVRCIKD